MPPKGQFRTCELLPGSSENIRRTATNFVERYEHGFVFCYVQLSAMDAPASMADLFLGLQGIGIPEKNGG